MILITYNFNNNQFLFLSLLFVVRVIKCFIVDVRYLLNVKQRKKITKFIDISFANVHLHFFKFAVSIFQKFMWIKSLSITHLNVLNIDCCFSISPFAFLVPNNLGKKLPSTTQSVHDGQNQNQNENEN